MTAPSVDVLASQVARMQKQIDNALEEIAAMKTVDALQNQKLDALTTRLVSVDDKLDKVVDFISETKGGKKWVLGILAGIATVMGIAVSYVKLS